MIPSAIDATFGNEQLRSDYSDCVIVVRHGFKSDHRPLVNISNQLRGSFTGAIVDNEDYTWTKPVLENGVELEATEPIAALEGARLQRPAQ